MEILIVVGGQPQQTITDVRNFEISPQLEILAEGYLGETADRFDEIFRGVNGRMELHFENSDIFNLIQSLVDRARRRGPAVTINIKATLNFPNGQNPKVILQNVFFGPTPINFGSRSDYGTLGLEFKASDFQRLS